MVLARDPSGALAALARAGHDPLRGAGRGGGPLTVCIPDLTRPLDPSPALRALADVAGPLQVVIGLGLHRPMTAAELEPLSAWAPVQSDPDDVVDIGGVEVMLSSGTRVIPGTLTRVVAEAERVVCVGICELHQYAGTSGGHKGVAVGCGGRVTVSALHHRDVVTDPGVRLGVVEGNPFRAAIDRLGERAGVHLALGYLPTRDAWLAGEPAALVRSAARLLDPWEPVDSAWSRVVLRVPPAKAASLYQASRAATYLALSPHPPLLPGAELILDAACPEGLGSEAGFVAALRSCPPPWSALLTGPPPTGAGAQRAVMLALLAQRYHLRVTGCRRPDELRSAGIDATAEPPPPGLPEVARPFSRLPQAVA